MDPEGRNASPLESLVTRAIAGDRHALAALVRAIQDDVYALALRMLWHPADAADATQEILVKIITRLGSFRGESAFKTWFYRVATNHLLNAKKSRGEARARSFEAIADGLEAGSAEAGMAAKLADAADPQREILALEVKLGCTSGMLLCLDRPHRVAFVLTDILQMSSDEGAVVAETSPAAFRKRASRARAKLREFLDAHCGVHNPAAACRCEAQVPRALRTGLLDPSRLLFARHARRDAEAQAARHVDELAALHDAARVYREHPDYAAPAAIGERIRALLESVEITSSRRS